MKPLKKNFSMKKLYYSISEVSKITDLEQYVLRYWETEFDQLKPAKNLAGNRIYTNKDIKLILAIKRLLRDEKYTIEGAKRFLKNYNAKEDSEPIRKKNEFKNTEKSDKDDSYTDLSLFTKDELNSNQKSSKDIIKDLKELRNFLSNLLQDLE